MLTEGLRSGRPRAFDSSLRYLNRSRAGFFIMRQLNLPLSSLPPTLRALCPPAIRTLGSGMMPSRSALQLMRSSASSFAPRAFRFLP